MGRARRGGTAAHEDGSAAGDTRAHLYSIFASLEVSPGFSSGMGYCCCHDTSVGSPAVPGAAACDMAAHGAPLRAVLPGATGLAAGDSPPAADRERVVTMLRAV